jgi:hypothetical protein
MAWDDVENDAIVLLQLFLNAGWAFLCVMRQGINAAQYAGVQLSSDSTIPT